MTQGKQFQLDELEELFVDQGPFVVRKPDTLPWKNSDGHAVSEAEFNLESPFLVPDTNTIDKSSSATFALAADSAATPFAQDSIPIPRQPRSPLTTSDQSAFQREHASLWQMGSTREGRLTETFTLDPYLPIRFAMTAEYARLSPQRISSILGPRAAALVLLEWLHLPATMRAVSSDLPGSGQRRSVQVGSRHISVSSYLKMLAYLCGKIAESGNASSAKVVAGAPVKETEVREELDVPHDAPQFSADISAALSGKKWPMAL
jgi:hypothetical protein